MIKSLSFIPLAIALALILGACLHLPTYGARPIAAVVVVLDLSPSTSEENRCEELAARLRAFTSAPEMKRFDVLVLGTGDADTALEPIALVPWKRWELHSALYEDAQQAEKARGAWIEEVHAQCRASAHATHSSPIYAALRSGVESLNAHCAEIAAHHEKCTSRTLFVHSDLRENAEPAIRERLSGLRARHGSATPLPKLDLAGISLFICGTADTRSTSGEHFVSPAAVSAVWHVILGEHAPAFDAVCPVETAPPTARGAAEQEARP
jgi:hypothetical protein